MPKNLKFKNPFRKHGDFAKPEMSRSLSTVQVVIRTFRQISFGRDIDELSEVEEYVDEFEHLKIRDLKQFSIGIVFICAISTCNAMLNNVVKNTSTDVFFSPAFVVWHRACYRMLTFPTYLMLKWLFERIVKRSDPPVTFKHLILDAVKFYGERKVSFSRWCKDLLILTVLTVITQYANWAPLYRSISTGTLAALQSSNIVFVFLLSAAFLKLEIVNAKIFGVVFAIIGLGILLLLEITSNPKWASSTAVIWGAISTAVYQVTFRIRVGGTTNLGRISFSVSLLGMLTAMATWPLVLVLKYTKVEEWEYHNLPWEMLMRTSAAAWALAFLINLGVAWTNPFFTSLGFLMVVPMTYVFDYFWNQRTTWAIDFVGSGLIATGFILLVFADVLTWDHFKQEWRNFRGNLQLCQNYTGRKVNAHVEKSVKLEDTTATAQLKLMGITVRNVEELKLPAASVARSGSFRPVDTT
ncbi:putative thiamine transporter SLC35F3 [Paramacrobiotus metropolitanus]|uniref:putative thiamine transporter SLC35F3 n=1 Tax=Paramacrobiotus metropolitanus TaxID=2943436 RepID=UPI002445E7A5|nr:putative thiamine transporter SLC35F3 [Paramacrobiotus metropolitanus]